MNSRIPSALRGWLRSTAGYWIAGLGAGFAVLGVVAPVAARSPCLAVAALAAVFAATCCERRRIVVVGLVCWLAYGTALAVAGVVGNQAGWWGDAALSAALFGLVTACAVVLGLETSMLREQFQHTSGELVAKVGQDHLTGLLNHRGFMLQGESSMRDAERGSRAPVLLYLDLDQFQVVNDRFSHAVGDGVLHAFARTLESNVQDHDLVARVDGEEFVILLTNSMLGGARLLADRVRTQTRSLAVANLPPEFTVTISVGIVRQLSGESLKDFISRGGAAMREVKAKGGDGFHVAGRQSK